MAIVFSLLLLVPVAIMVSLYNQENNRASESMGGTAIAISILGLFAALFWFLWQRQRRWFTYPEQHPLFRKWHTVGDAQFLVRQLGTELQQPSAFRSQSGLMATRSWVFWNTTPALYAVDDVVGTTAVVEKSHPAMGPAMHAAGLLGALVVWLFTRKERKQGAMYQVRLFLRTGTPLIGRLPAAEVQAWMTALKAHAPWAFVESSGTYASRWWWHKKKWIAEADARKGHRPGISNTRSPIQSSL